MDISLKGQVKEMAISYRKRKEIFERDGGRCQICNHELHIDMDRRNDNYYVQLDHIVPKSKGGSNQKDNLRALCKSCNSRRGVWCGSTLKTFLINRFWSTLIDDGLQVERMKDDFDNKLLTLDDISEIEGHLIETFKINMRCLKEVKRHAQGGVSE